jgi:hypothetical protein
VEPCLVQNKAIAARALFDDEDKTSLLLFNPSDQRVYIRKGVAIANAQAVNFACSKCDSGVCSCPPARLHSANEQQSVTRMIASDPGGKTKVECRNAVSAASVDGKPRVVIGSDKVITDDHELIAPMMKSLPHDLTEQQRNAVEGLLLKYSCIFARFEYDVGCASNVSVKLEEVDQELGPVKEALRPQPLAYQQALDPEVDRLISANIISPISSEWRSNILLIQKKSLPGEPVRFRLAVDLRKVNRRLRCPGFPMPTIQSVWDGMSNKSRFSLLDLSQAYLSLPLHEDSRKYTSFCARRGQFCFNRLTAGLAAAPALWNQFIQSLFADLNWDRMWIFLDDFTLASSSVDEGIQLLEIVFERIKQANLRLKGSKCVCRDLVGPQRE